MTDKLDYIKIKNFHSSKDTTKEGKREGKEWENICATRINDKGLTCRIGKEL